MANRANFKLRSTVIYHRESTRYLNCCHLLCCAAVLVVYGYFCVLMHLVLYARRCVLPFTSMSAAHSEGLGRLAAAAAHHLHSATDTTSLKRVPHQLKFGSEPQDTVEGSKLCTHRHLQQCKSMSSSLLMEHPILGLSPAQRHMNHATRR